LPRYDEAAQLLTGERTARAEDGAAWIQGLAAELGIPSLGRYGLTREMLPDAAAKSARASSMKGNPVSLTQEEMVAILEQASA
jgi:alcohol dehydrogenase class IV